MRRHLLGASLALAMVAGRLPAQSNHTSSPAPVVPVSTMDGSVDSGGLSGADYGSGAPIAPLGGGILESGGAMGLGRPVGGGNGTGYVEGSFLLMWTSDANMRTPLVTGGPSLGILGAPGTTIANNRNISYDSAPGLKIAMGRMLGDSRIGYEVSAFYLGEETFNQSFGNTSSTVIARPFFDPGARAENSRIIAAPGAFNGGVKIASGSSVWGFEAGPFLRTSASQAFTVDLIAGFRYLQHHDDLLVVDTSNILAGGTSSFNGFGLASPSTVSVTDYIGATNTFYGGQVGAKFGFGQGNFFLDLTAKVAIGGVNSRVNIDGRTTATGGPFPAQASTGGGLLSADGRYGVRTENQFAVVPEGNAQIGYQLTNWMNVFAGYSFTYMSNAARAAEQADRTINAGGLPTSPTYRPVASRPTELVNGDLWFHGFNFGATVTY